MKAKPVSLRSPHSPRESPALWRGPRTPLSGTRHSIDCPYHRYIIDRRIPLQRPALQASTCALSARECRVRWQSMTHYSLYRFNYSFELRTVRYGIVARGSLISEYPELPLVPDVLPILGASPSVIARCSGEVNRRRSPSRSNLDLKAEPRLLPSGSSCP
jgi:hypothetical protein